MDMQERKKRARGATLGAPDVFKTIGVQIGDELFAVREPTVREHAEIMKAAQLAQKADGTQDIAYDKLRVAAVVKCACLGDPVMDGDKPKTETVPVLGPNGKPALDADGKPVTKERPVVTAGDRVYDDTDLEGMLVRRVSGFVGQLGDAALELMNVTQTKEDPRKSDG